MLDKLFASGSALRCDFRKPDRGFHGLELAEEWTDVVELEMPPVFEQCRSFWSDLPVIGAWKVPPGVHVKAQVVDDRRRVVRLLFGRKTLALIEDERSLAGLLFFGLWNRGDERRRSTGVYRFLCRLPLWVELPVSRRWIVR